MNVITTNALLAKYVNVVSNFETDRLLPFESISKLEFLDRYLSPGLILQILAQETEAIGTYKNEVYQRFMLAHCSFTVRKFLNQGEVNISELGVTRTENENTKTAYANQVKQLKNDLEDNSFLAIGDLILLLENDTDSFFTANWQASVGFANRSSLIIKSALDFNSIETIYRPQTTFIMMIPQMQIIQLLVLPSYFNTAIVNEWIANDPAMDSVKSSALNLVKYAIVNLTVAESMLKNIVKITPNGIASFSDTQDTNSDVSAAATSQDASTPYQMRKKEAARFLSQAKQLLIDGGFINQETFTHKRFTA